MRETTIEQRVVAGAKRAGGLAIKWVAPGMSGVPDRIVFLPGGRVLFVEVKAPGESVRPLQATVHTLLVALGADVRVVDSLSAADALFR